MHYKVRVSKGYKKIIHSKAKAIKTRLLVELKKAVLPYDIDRLVCKAFSEYRKQTDKYIYDCD